MKQEDLISLTDSFKSAIQGGLPLNANSVLRVAIQEEDDLLGLKRLLDNKFEKFVKTWGKLEETYIKDTKKADDKERLEQATRDKAHYKKLDETNSFINKLINTIIKREKESGDDSRNFANVVSQVGKQLLDGGLAMNVEQAKYAAMLQHLNATGVRLTDGFESLSLSAVEAGQTSTEFAKRLGQIAPTISKLNGSMGNGVKLYSQFTKQMLDFGLTAEENDALFANGIAQLTAAQMTAMGPNGLVKHLKSTAVQMDKLSKATGKSVETITAEADLRKREMRLQAWANDPKNLNTFRTLSAMGMGDAETIDFLRTGIPTEKIATAMAGNKDYAILMRSLQTQMSLGNEITPEMVGKIQNELRPIYNSETQRRGGLANNSGIYAAAGNSDAFQSFAFGSGIMNDFYNTNFSTGSLSKSDRGVLGNLNKGKAGINAMKELKTQTMIGGYSGVSGGMKAFAVAGEAMSASAKTFIQVGNKLSNLIEGVFGPAVAEFAAAVAGLGATTFGGSLATFAGDMLSTAFGNIIGGAVTGGGIKRGWARTRARGRLLKRKTGKLLKTKGVLSSGKKALGTIASKGRSAIGGTLKVGKNALGTVLSASAGLIGGAVGKVGTGIAKGGSGVLKAGKVALGGTKSVLKKTIAKKASKAFAKAGLKSIGKKIPGIGAILGTGLAISRAMQGDWTGALMEFGSGVASTIPGLGTAASLALDAGLMAKDMHAASKAANVGRAVGGTARAIGGAVNIGANAYTAYKMNSVESNMAITAQKADSMDITLKKICQCVEMVYGVVSDGKSIEYKDIGNIGATVQPQEV